MDLMQFQKSSGLESRGRSDKELSGIESRDGKLEGRVSETQENQHRYQREGRRQVVGEPSRTDEGHAAVWPITSGTNWLGKNKATLNQCQERRKPTAGSHSERRADKSGRARVPTADFSRRPRKLEWSGIMSPVHQKTAVPT